MPDPIEKTEEVTDPQIPPVESPDNIPFAKDDKHLHELVSTMPDVVPDAVAASQEKEKQTENIQSTTKDKKGRAFDPNFHVADEHGNPQFTATGRFKRKFVLPGQNKQQAGLVIPQDQPAPDQKIELAAQKLADVFIITGISFFGDEWRPEQSKDFNERQMLVDANKRWMIEHGYLEPPAWIDLALAYGLYTGKRIITRKPEGRIERIYKWSKMQLSNMWLTLSGQKIKIIPTDK